MTNPHLKTDKEINDYLDKKGIKTNRKIVIPIIKTLIEFEEQQQQRQFNDDGYDAEGYDKDGYDKNGWDRDGWNRQKFDKDGLFLGLRKYNNEGRDKNGRYNPHFDTKKEEWRIYRNR